MSHVGLGGQTPDLRIFEFARENGFTIVTADFDFIRLVDSRGTPPKVIRLEKMDYSTEVAADLIRRFAIALAEFDKGTKSVLIFPRPSQPTKINPASP